MKCVLRVQFSIEVKFSNSYMLRYIVENEEWNQIMRSQRDAK